MNTDRLSDNLIECKTLWSAVRSTHYLGRLGVPLMRLRASSRRERCYCRLDVRS